MKHNCLRTGLLCLVIAVSSAQAWAADSAPAERSAAGTAARPTGPDLVTLNFVNADIEGVVKAVSEITGKNFVLDPRVKGTINIVSAKPMSRSLVYEVFLSAMRLQGFTAVEERGRVAIVPEVDAKLHQSLVTGPQDKSRAAGDTIRTQVFKLQHESATQLVPVLRPLIAANNTINAYQNNNTLVITDYASNLARIEKIIESIDQPAGGADPIMIQLKYASALDVAQTINRLFAEAAQNQASPDASLRFAVTVDARSNSILARSGEPSRLARVRQLVAMLDSPTSAAGNIHVVYLKNAEAVKLAEILRAIYSGESALGQTRAAATPTPLGQPQVQAQPAAAMPGIIQADAATNSIIITAPEAIYNNLRAALEKLDVRRAQVHVEALIAEVTADRAAEFGVQWQDLTGVGKTTGQVFGGTNFGSAGQNIIGVAQNPLTAGQGLNIGVIKGTITVGGAQILNLGLLARALQTDANANILSTPSLLTLDNEEAKIVIGQNVPFITGSYAVSAAATTPTPFQTIERKDVGLTLRIKPQISEGGAVRLQIFQEVSNVQDSTNASGLITNKRSVESTVLVDDGQIVVIGGLIQDSVKDGVQKIPGLGDIPIIGSLFTYNTRSRSKTNLMVFLRPTLLRNAQRVNAVSSDRYDYILGEQIKAKPGTVNLPDFGSPALPQRQSAEPGAASKPAIAAPK
jgi:general secretion pathway protein D